MGRKSSPERDYVVGMYKGEGWKRKVAAMPHHQVVAIYLRAQSETPKPKPAKESEDDGPEDLRLF